MLPNIFLLFLPTRRASSRTKHGGCTIWWGVRVNNTPRKNSQNMFNETELLCSNRQHWHTRTALSLSFFDPAGISETLMQSLRQILRCVCGWEKEKFKKHTSRGHLNVRDKDIYAVRQGRDIRRKRTRKIIIIKNEYKNQKPTILIQKKKKKTPTRWTKFIIWNVNILCFFPPPLFTEFVLLYESQIDGSDSLLRMTNRWKRLVFWITNWQKRLPFKNHESMETTWFYESWIDVNESLFINYESMEKTPFSESQIDGNDSLFWVTNRWKRLPF